MDNKVSISIDNITFNVNKDILNVVLREFSRCNTECMPFNSKDKKDCIRTCKLITLQYYSS